MRWIDRSFLVLFTIISVNCPAQKNIKAVDFGAYFTAHKVEGCFVLYDLEKDQLLNKRFFLPGW